MHRVTALLVALLLLTALPAAAIINGQPADPGEYPSAVALLNAGTEPPAERHLCGGTLVAPEYVLTAAHCFFDRGVQESGSYDVVIGSEDLNGTSGQLLAVAETILHPAYEPLREFNDVALLRLAEPSSQPLQRLLSPGEDALAAPGTTATVVGYGDTDPAPGDDRFVPSPRLLETDVPIRTDADCAATEHPDQPYDAARQLCAGNGDQGTHEAPTNESCGGDSGGPLFVRDGGALVQVGVVSYGPEFCGADGPSVYAEVLAYRAWISGIIGGTAPPAAPDPANPDPGAGSVPVARVAGGGPATEAVTQAAAASQVAFDAENPAEYAVLARADVFADALGGSALGYGLGPVLFTDASGALPQATRDELQRAVPSGSDVYVLGGGAAVPASVDGELEALGFNPVRIAGTGREETAALVADEVVAAFGEDGAPAQDTMIVATGANWPDAVTAGQLGAWWGIPVLLTPPDLLHPATRAALESHEPATVLVIGGTAAVSEAVAAEIGALGSDVARLGGPTRTGTAAAVLAHHLALFEQAGEQPQEAIAVNLRRPDAFAHVLSASTLVGSFAGVFVPLEGDAGDTLTADVAAVACRLDLPLTVAGGPDLVSDAGAVAVQRALVGDGC